MPSISERVGASDDDAAHSQNNHAFAPLSVASGMGDTTGSGVTGRGLFVRFSSVPIPQGATIQSAIITSLSADSQSGTVVRLVIEAENADDPSAIVDDTNWHALARTVASVSWNPGATTLDAEFDTPSLVSIVQELVDRPGWASGQAMQFLLHDDAQLSDTNAVRWAYTYDNDPAKAGLLIVTYAAAATAKKAILLMGS